MPVRIVGFIHLKLRKAIKEEFLVVFVQAGLDDSISSGWQLHSSDEGYQSKTAMTSKRLLDLP